MSTMGVSATMRKPSSIGYLSVTPLAYHPCIATTAAVRALLAPTSLPDQLVDDLLAEASAIWLMGETAEVLAGDLVLCYPALAPEEVRATALPTGSPNAWRLTVAAHDRPGLLAGLAGALA